MKRNYRKIFPVVISRPSRDLPVGHLFLKIFCPYGTSPAPDSNKSKRLIFVCLILCTYRRYLAAFA